MGTATVTHISTYFIKSSSVFSTLTCLKEISKREPRSHILHLWWPNPLYPFKRYKACIVRHVWQRRYVSGRPKTKQMSVRMFFVLYYNNYFHKCHELFIMIIIMVLLYVISWSGSIHSCNCHCNCGSSSLTLCSYL